MANAYGAARHTRTVPTHACGRGRGGAIAHPRIARERPPAAVGVG
ncbi:hypothetical protein [Halostreptopolyspora alba]